MENTNIIENNLIDENIDKDELLKLSIDEYKSKLNKKVKEMNKEELKIYNEIKLKKKHSDYKENKILDNITNNEIKFQENESNENEFIKLESLKNKFPEVFENIQYDKQMTKETLDTKHKLAMKIIEEKHSHHVAFSLFIMITKATENISSEYLSYDGLNGLTETTCEMKDEITDVLKEMIDTGELPVEALTPKMRLALIMSGAVIKTIEKNNSKNGVSNAAEDIETN